MGRPLSLVTLNINISMIEWLQEALDKTSVVNCSTTALREAVLLSLAKTVRITESYIISLSLVTRRWSCQAILIIFDVRVVCIWEIVASLTVISMSLAAM